tara:strand:- start:476 stop:1456 length:981 start_codon:yes stop_codon:yes gene_type:complete
MENLKNSIGNGSADTTSNNGIVADHLLAIRNWRVSNNGRDRGSTKSNRFGDTYVSGDTPTEEAFNRRLQFFDKTYGIGSAKSKGVGMGRYPDMYENIANPETVSRITTTPSKKLTWFDFTHFIMPNAPLKSQTNTMTLDHSIRTVVRAFHNVATMQESNMPTTHESFNQWFDKRNNGKVVSKEDKELPQWFTTYLDTMLSVRTSTQERQGLFATLKKNYSGTGIARAHIKDDFFESLKLQYSVDGKYTEEGKTLYWYALNHAGAPKELANMTLSELAIVKKVLKPMAKQFEEARERKSEADKKAEAKAKAVAKAEEAFENSYKEGK